MLLAKHYSFTFKKYKDTVGKDLQRRLEIVAEFHDDGKDDQLTLNKWQRACQLDYECFLDWQKNHGGTFRDYCKKKPVEAGANLRKSGVRHEFQSLVIHERKKLHICLQVAIASHHGKLGFSSEDRWIREGVERFWKLFRRESNRVLDENISLKDIAKIHYEFAGPRGLLQLSDHRASAIEDGDPVPNHVPFKYTFPHPQKRNVQKLIDQYWQDDLLLIRAPTGAGKTDASLLWASKQIENQKAQRLVIAMPTRFTSNALAISVAENLSDTGLYHSSAWFKKYQEKVDSGELQKDDATKQHEFARLLQTPVTVCTIDHLLMALTLTREDHHLITFNLANSCVVIDEADFYDDFTQANILVFLELLRYWNVPVLLMSASIPDSALPAYQKLGFAVTEIKEDNTDKYDYTRPRFAIRSIETYHHVNDIEHLLEKALKKGSGIIYANTVEKATQFLAWFEDKDIETCLYHSRFTEPDKVKKEENLIRMLGRKAWRQGTAGGIAILTQIGEMSINISADLMISDLSPIDRLTQRAGRLCRFDPSKLGELYILIPQKGGTLYPAPYGQFSRKTNEWIASNALESTRRIVRCGEYSAEKLVQIINEVYNDQPAFSAVASANAKNLKEYFKLNWMISSRELSNQDDHEVNFWKSRQIPPQETVFVTNPEIENFSNYLSFQHWKIKNSIELPMYLIEKAKDRSIMDLKTIRIKDEVEYVYVVREGFYSFDKGIDFESPDQMQ